MDLVPKKISHTITKISHGGSLSWPERKFTSSFESDSKIAFLTPHVFAITTLTRRVVASAARDDEDGLVNQ